jgi:hypothetical protein
LFQFSFFHQQVKYQLLNRVKDFDLPASRCLPARALQWQAGEALRAGGGQA